MRFALEHQNPLITSQVTGGDAAYPADNFSLLTISNDDVVLWAVKPADDSIMSGVIARVWNLSTSPSTFAMSAPNDTLLSAVHTSHIETPFANVPLTGGTLTDNLEPQRIKTYGLVLNSLVASLDKKSYLPVIQIN
jgi:alpha-mannosidase